IMRGDAGERPVRRPLQPFHRGIALAHTLEHGLAVLDLDAEMVEAGGAPSPARVDVQAHIAVADSNRATRPRLVRGLHAERGDVDVRELGVVSAHDRHLLVFGEHHRPPGALTGVWVGLILLYSPWPEKLLTLWAPRVAPADRGRIAPP